jgi:hypothetical protein
LQDGSYNGHLLCSKWSQLNVEITIVPTIATPTTRYNDPASGVPSLRNAADSQPDHARQTTSASCLRKYPGVQVPSSSTIFEFVKNAFTWSLLDEKYARDNACYSCALEHLLGKSPARLAQAARIS